jgi:hypothetical protein
MIRKARTVGDAKAEPIPQACSGARSQISYAHGHVESGGDINALAALTYRATGRDLQECATQLRWMPTPTPTPEQE